MYLYILFNKVKRIRIAQSKFTIYIVYIKTIIYHPRIRGYFVLSKIQNRVILSAYLYCVECVEQGSKESTTSLSTKVVAHANDLVISPSVYGVWKGGEERWI